MIHLKHQTLAVYSRTFLECRTVLVIIHEVEDLFVLFQRESEF